MENYVSNSSRSALFATATLMKHFLSYKIKLFEFFVGRQQYFEHLNFENLIIYTEHHQAQQVHINFLARKENYSQLHWTFMILHVGINNSSCSRVHGQDDIMHVSIIVIKHACGVFKA